MKKRLIAFNSLILTVAIAIVFGLGLFFAQRSLLSQAESTTIMLANAYADGYQASWTSLSVEEDNVRLSIISSDGTVLLDSEYPDTSSLENHLNRPEIQNALSGNEGGAVARSSSSLGVEMLYYAVKVEIDAGNDYVFVRVALTLSSINSYFLSYLPWMILVLVFAIASSIALSYFLSKRSLAPLITFEKKLRLVSDGVYDSESYPSGDKEVDQIMEDLDKIGASLSQTMASLSYERERLSLIIDNISDGLVVFDEEGRILLVNKVAKAIFEVDDKAIGQSSVVLSGGPTFQKEIRKNIDHFEFESRGRYYVCTIGQAFPNMILVINDVTPERQAAEMRKDFFDSASHELKTPLTSIQGFNELIAFQSQDEKIKGYCELIQKESARMLSLIQDMLQLSKIEKQEKAKYRRIELSSIASDVFEELSPQAEHYGVSLTKEGQCKIAIDPKDAYSIMKNLLENAIRYNHEGGHATLKLSSSSLIVEDDGNGIPDKDQPHIFERFYRVDKSRSRADGGTGLGLSIVKHLCAVYGFKVTLESTLGLGTRITISFA